MVSKDKIILWKFVILIQVKKIVFGEIKVDLGR